MKEAIKKAIEGGWSPKGLNVEGHPISWIIQATLNRSKFYERYIFDPLFWQALGKAMEWGKDEAAIEKLRKDIDYENRYYENALAHPTETEQFYQALEKNKQKIGRMYLELDTLLEGLDWKNYWHRFIDHLAEGKDAESFFNELLK